MILRTVQILHEVDYIFREKLFYHGSREKVSIDHYDESEFFGLHESALRSLEKFKQCFQFYYVRTLVAKFGTSSQIAQKR